MLIALLHHSQWLLEIFAFYSSFFLLVEATSELKEGYIAFSINYTAALSPNNSQSNNATIVVPAAN